MGRKKKDNTVWLCSITLTDRGAMLISNMLGTCLQNMGNEYAIAVVKSAIFALDHAGRFRYTDGGRKKQYKPETPQ